MHSLPYMPAMDTTQECLARLIIALQSEMRKTNITFAELRGVLEGMDALLDARPGSKDLWPDVTSTEYRNRRLARDLEGLYHAGYLDKQQEDRYASTLDGILSYASIPVPQPHKDAAREALRDWFGKRDT